MKNINTQWKAKANQKQIICADTIIYAIYKALRKDGGIEEIKAELRKAFTPITNTTKLANGARPFGTLDQALWRAKYSSMLDWFDAADKDKILGHLATLRSKEFS